MNRGNVVVPVLWLLPVAVASCARRKGLAKVVSLGQEIPWMHGPDERPRPPEPIDPTPVVGAATDVARLTHQKPVPPHEQTADEDAQIVDWDRVAATDDFRNLIKAKVKFVVPATIFFIVYYFALPVLVGYAPEFMQRKVIGVVNLAYVFALSQFFMAWIIAWLYVRAAARFDRMEKEVILKFTNDRNNKRGGN